MKNFLYSSALIAACVACLVTSQALAAAVKPQHGVCKGGTLPSEFQWRTDAQGNVQSSFGNTHFAEFNNDGQLTHAIGPNPSEGTNWAFGVNLDSSGNPQKTWFFRGILDGRAISTTTATCVISPY